MDKHGQGNQGLPSIETEAVTSPELPKQEQHYLFKDLLQSSLLVSIPFIYLLPSGVFFYWIPSSIFGIIKNNLVRNINFQRIFKLPITSNPSINIVNNNKSLR